MNSPRDKHGDSHHSLGELHVCWGILLALCVCFLFPRSSAFAVGQPPQKRVLILYSFENEVGLYSDFDDSLRATLKAGERGRIRFYTEYLDLARFPNRAHEKELKDVLRAKYSTEKIDLIFPVSLPAINFIVDHGEELFPGIPAVFCAVDRRWVLRLPLPLNTTGIVETTKINKTLAVALQLQPDTRRVVVVGGTLPYEQDWLKEIQNDLREYEGKLDFTYLTGLPMEELLARLAELPQHTIVLYMMMWRDGAGEYFLPKEALRQMSQASSAPIYGVFESFLGSGMVGGDLIPFKTAGTMAAEMGLHVLKGERPADIPILSEDNASYVFDWRQLHRWRISEKRLPPGSVVRFSPPSAWKLYEWRIIGLALLIAAEAILIAFLLIQHRKRQRAEASLQKSETRYLAFVANSSEGIARFEGDAPMPLSFPEDAQIQFMFHHAQLAECNDAFARMYNVADPKSFVGARLVDLLPASDTQNVEFLRALIRSHYRLLGHATHERDAQGNMHWFDNSATGIIENGHLVRAWVVQRDITERRMMQDQIRNAEARYRGLVESSHDWVWEVDDAGVYTYVGPQCREILGYEPEELVGKTPFDLMPPEEAERVRLAFAEISGKQRSFRALENTNLHKDGHLVVLETNGVPIFDEQGKFCGYRGMDRDITKRKEAEDELRASEKKYRELHESMIDGFVRVEMTGKIIEFNDAYQRMLGYEPEELLNLTYLDLTPEKWHALEADIVERQVMVRGHSEVYEKEYRRKDGTIIPVEFRTYLMRHETGKPCGMWGIVRDITERKKAERALEEYENAVENSEDMVLVVDREYRHVVANRALLEKFGLTREQAVGHTVSDVVGEEFFQRVAKQRIDECFAGTAVQFESEYAIAGLGDRNFTVSFYPIHNASGIDRVCGVLHDITERKQAEQALKEYAKVVENAQDMVAVVDREYRYLIANRPYLEHVGRERGDVIGHTVSEVLGEEFFEKVVKNRLNACFQGNVQQYDTKHRSATGSERDLFATYFPLESATGIERACCVVQDMTERERAEAELAERLRFETLLAGLSSRFVHVPAEQIDAEISQALCRVCESLNLEMGTLWRSLAAPGFTVLTHYYGPAGGPPPVGHLNGRELFPWCFRMVTAGEIVAVSSLEQLPAEAAHDGESWRQFGIKSNLTFGLAVGGKDIVGALSFNTLESERPWPEPLVKRLELVAQMFSNALARQNADGALRESEERFRGLVENASVGIYRTTPDGRILMANPALTRMLGYADFASLATRNLEEEGFEPAYSRKEFREHLETEGQVNGLEAAWRRADGAVIFVRESARAIRGEDGKILYYDGIVEDITEHKKAEDAVRRAERQYRDIFEGALEGMCRTTPEGKFLAANPALARMLGYSSAEELVSSITNSGEQVWVDAKGREVYVRVLEEHGVARGYEARYKRKDGTKIWVSLDTRRVPGPDGKTLYYEGFVGDITERKLAEHALRRQADFNEMMMGVLNRFATCPPSGVDGAVVKALECIAEFIGADHAFVIQFSADLTTWSATHEWCGANVEPKIKQYQSEPMGTIPWTESRLLAGKVVRINSSQDYPTEAVQEHRHQETEGFCSTLTVPIQSKSGVLGNIGLHSHARPVIWSDNDVVRLRMVGDAVASALERQQAQEELQRSVEALQRRGAFDKLIREMLASFAVSPLSDLDGAVERALRSIAEFIRADHAFVVGIAADLTSWGVTHEWCGPNVTPRRPLFQNMPMGTNPEVERLILEGRVIRINSPDDLAPHLVAERRHQAGEGFLAELEIPMRSKRGILANIGLHSHARPLVWSDDDVAHLRIVGDAVVNALDRKQVIEELQKSEGKFSTAFHASPVAMSILSLATGCYLEVNKAFEDNTGLRADEIVGRTPKEPGIYANPADLEKIFQEMTVHDPLRNLEVQYRTKSGDLRTALLSAELIEFGGEPCSLRVMEDITERKRLEQAAREIGARMVMVQEEERRRVARDLHDDFSQRLALLAIDLEQLAQRPPTTKQEWSARIQAMWSQTQELTTDVHHLSYQLHPSKLEDLGLVAAVRSYCRGLSRQAGLDVKFSAANVPEVLPKEISLCLYRIAQEALRNVTKHSGVKTATVELSGGPNEVRLAVSDPGKGFAVETTRGGGGLGLVSMQERVRYVGGVWSLDSRPYGGTRVMVRVPVSRSAASEEVAGSSKTSG